MDSSSLLLVGLSIPLQIVTLVLCLRRAQADGQSGILWGLLAFFIWPAALLALLVTRSASPAEPGTPTANAAPAPPASLAAAPPAHQPLPLAPSAEADYDDAPPAEEGMSIYTPFILNGVGLLLLFGLARGDGDTLGALLVGVLALMAANTALMIRAFAKRESGLAVCCFVVVSAGSALLLWVASGWGHR